MKKFEDNLRELVSDNCDDSDKITETISLLLDQTTSLFVFLYVRTIHKSYADFENYTGGLLETLKRITLDKYLTSMEKEL